MNSRISNQELADKVSLSPSPCLRRVNQLETSGYISQYAALLDAEKIGLTLIIITVVGLHYIPKTARVTLKKMGVFGSRSCSAI